MQLVSGSGSLEKIANETTRIFGNTAGETLPAQFSSNRLNRTHSSKQKTTTPPKLGLSSAATHIEHAFEPGWPALGNLMEYLRKETVTSSPSFHQAVSSGLSQAVFLSILLELNAQHIHVEPPLTSKQSDERRLASRGMQSEITSEAGRQPRASLQGKRASTQQQRQQQQKKQQLQVRQGLRKCRQGAYSQVSWMHEL